MNAVIEKLPAGNDFLGQINSIFHASLDDGTAFDLSLVSLEDGVSGPHYESFSLIFRAPVSIPPVQSTYRVENAALGGMDMFLVPVKKDNDGLYFEAVFNCPAAV